MMRHAGATVVLIGTAILTAGSSVRAGAIEWQHDFETARRMARQSGRILLVNIHASWCGPCRKMQATTLQDPRVTKLVSDYCVAVDIDADENPELVRQFGVTGLPTQIFLSPTGQRAGFVEGFTDAAGYSANLQQAVAMAGIGRSSSSSEVASRTPSRRVPEQPVVDRRQEAARAEQELAAAIAERNSRRAAQQPVETPLMATRSAPPINLPPPVGYSQDRASFVPAPPPRPNFSGDAPVVASIPPVPPIPQNLMQSIPAPVERPVREGDKCDCDIQAPLALNGYCPVSMISRAELVPGARNVCLVYQGQKYHFASASDRSLFLQSPDRYLPAESGHCVVSLVEDHQWREGRYDLPAIFGEHVYFFSDQTLRDKFLKDPERYVDQSGRAYRDRASALR